MSEDVRIMFAGIAKKYDLMNTLLSFGIHHRWRQQAVRISGATHGSQVLDCASGTGDLAIEFASVVGREGKVTATDFCSDMLELAKPKAEARHLKINFQTADAMKLPFPDNSFDISSIAFGIRNVDDPVVAMSEMARVVKPGGKIVILEFGQPEGFFSFLYRIYSKIYMPLVGALIARNKEAYTYLPRTASQFPCKRKFLALMRETGNLRDCSYLKLSRGIAFIYVGTVIE